MQLDTNVTTTMRAGRVVLLMLAAAGLLLGLWAGLIRLGWALPAGAAMLPALHGPLMACGFLGALIGLERAVGTGQRWAYAGPLLVSGGVLVALLGFGVSAGAWLVTAGSVITALVLFGLVRLQPALFTGTMAAGGAAWVIGNIVWATNRPLPLAALWWMGFLVLTIAGERLELSRMLKLSAWSRRLFVAAAALLLIGMVAAWVDYATGMAIAGAALLGIALWLLRYDIARRRIKAGGQARFTAVALLSGYVWLAVGGALMLRYAGVSGGPYYDAALHSIFVGFVFAMIFAHAPIVFPAVLRLPMTFSRSLYIPLVLLDAALLLRVAGDLSGWWTGRLWGGMLNALVILSFLVLTAASLRPQRAHPAPARAQPTSS